MIISGHGRQAALGACASGFVGAADQLTYNAALLQDHEVS
jgi:hypothetical protein